MDMIDRLISREGGARITQDSSDTGGTTKYGISSKSYPDVDIAKLQYDGARAIYYRDYLMATNIYLLPELVQELALDFAVHSGPRKAITSLQRLVGVAEDGLLGPLTIDAAKALKVGDLCRAYTIDRVGYLCRQVQTNPSKLKYLTGWITRVLSLLP